MTTAQMHHDLAVARVRIERLKDALHKIAYEPIGHSEASVDQVYEDIVKIARDVLAKEY